MADIIVLTQARLNSSRFPEKVLQKIDQEFNSITLLKKRISLCKEPIDHFFIVPEKDKKLIKFLSKNKINYETGSESDLISRHHNCALKHNAKLIVRITSDCPLIDPIELDRCINLFKQKKDKFLYLSNHTPPEDSDYPNGSDIEIFSSECLSYIKEKYTSKKDKEHVTFPMWDGREKFFIKHLKLRRAEKPKNVGKIRITLDHPEDLEVFKIIAKELDIKCCSLNEIEQVYCKFNLFQLNSKFDSREGWK